MRYLFYSPNSTESNVDSAGIKFIISTEDDNNVSPVSIATAEKNSFYGDIINIPKDSYDANKSYNAIGFITKKQSDGTTKTLWSPVVPNQPNFDGAHFSEYDCYVEQQYVRLNYSDDFLYRFGTINQIPLDITYYDGDIDDTE